MGWLQNILRTETMTQCRQTSYHCCICDYSSVIYYRLVLIVVQLFPRTQSSHRPVPSLWLIWQVDGRHLIWRRVTGEPLGWLGTELSIYLDAILNDLFQLPTKCQIIIAHAGAEMNIVFPSVIPWVQYPDRSQIEKWLHHDLTSISLETTMQDDKFKGGTVSTETIQEPSWQWGLCRLNCAESWTPIIFIKPVAACNN